MAGVGSHHHRLDRCGLTLPKAAVDRFPGVDYFDVREESGRIILSPVVPQAADRVREKLAEVGIGPEDIAAAVRWARRS